MKDFNIKLIRNDPKKALLVLTYPIIISTLLSSFNNFVDAIWIVNLGFNAILVMGIVSPIFIIIVRVGNAIGIGGNVLISKSIGEDNLLKAKNVVFNTLYVGIFFSFLIPLIAIPFIDYFITIMGLDVCYDMAFSYLAPIIYGACFLMMLPLLAQISNAQGLTKMASGVLIVGNLINIILDPIFIYVLNWGMFGAIFISLLGNFISIIIFLYLLRV